MARLELDGVCKGFDRPILDRLSLTVEEGEFFVVVGPSGIGKTTLLRCIAGLEVLDGGCVIIAGRDVTNVPPYRRNVAMTFESYALYPHLSVFENIASPLRARRQDQAAVEKAVSEVARLLRIDQLLDRRPHEISGGQKQRTALGRTLVARPDVFLLDEPISHLDAKIRHELRRQFHHLQELRRVATVYVTHDYAEALSLGDRIGIMGNGGLVQIGTAREVFGRPSTLFVARHLGQPSINEIRCRLTTASGQLRAVANGGSLSLPVAGAHAAALDGGKLAEVTVGIRPQHASVDMRAVSGAVFVADAKVEIFEALGATGVLIAEVGGVSLTALTSPDAHFEPGQPVRLALAVDQFMYFNPATGRNLHA
jgi:multiple sugar transport system ATP-binding protein